MAREAFTAGVAAQVSIYAPAIQKYGIKMHSELVNKNNALVKKLAHNFHIG
jgi:hypothetical protein